VTRRAAGVQPLQRLSRLPQTTTVEDVTMGGFGGLALLFAIAAAVGVLNYHGPKLPETTGMLLGGLGLALIIIGIDAVSAEMGLRHTLATALGKLNFSRTLLEGLLGYLLFAGAIRLDLGELLSRKWVVLLLAIFGTTLSTALIGFSMWGITGLFGVDIPLRWWLVFGALISPTDPVSVLDVLRRIGVSPTLRTTIAGESLFNDGAGIVLFGVFAGHAISGRPLHPLPVATELLRVVGGSLALGLAAGWVVLRIVRHINARNLELLISLALASGVYSLALHLSLSGPVAVAIAGITLGNHGVRYALSERGSEHMFRFWSFVEELVTAILFLLIGLEVATLQPARDAGLAAAIAIPVCLLARGASVAAAALPRVIRLRHRSTAGLVLLTWGGLRGALSVALVLALQPSHQRDVLLACCYAVVLWSLVVQNLSLARVARRLLPPDSRSDAAAAS
jgi:CPA1 family monovalent cation:H+ antiporter